MLGQPLPRAAGARKKPSGGAMSIALTRSGRFTLQGRARRADGETCASERSSCLVSGAAKLRFARNHDSRQGLSRFWTVSLVHFVQCLPWLTEQAGVACPLLKQARTRRTTMRRTALAALALTVTFASVAHADVIINEVMYRPYNQ